MLSEPVLQRVLEAADLPPLPDPAQVPVLPIEQAGRYVGLGRAASYRAAKSGFLPTIQLSEHRYAVPTAGLRKLLGLDGGEL